MNTKNNSIGWDVPKAAPEFLAKHQADDIAIFDQLRINVADMARANGWTKAEISRRTDIPSATFSQWFSGQYAGTLANINRQVENWLRAVAEAKGLAAAIPASPAFLHLKSSVDIIKTLEWAQVSPDLVMITCGAGVGKTEACRFYETTRPHVYRATVSENTKTVHGMLTELASELEVNEHNPARLARAIGNKVRRMGSGTLLIVDEGQHLNDEALNQLRHFVDVYRCGVAVVGNKEVYDRFAKGRKGPSYAQLKSRIGVRLQIDNPYKDDLLRFIEAWGVYDEDIVTFLVGIGMKGGAFRQIDKTMKLASMLATGLNESLSLRHIRKAWSTRNVEDLA